jgi:hypothetical protein
MAKSKDVTMTDAKELEVTMPPKKKQPKKKQPKKVVDEETHEMRHGLWVKKCRG